MTRFLLVLLDHWGNLVADDLVQPELHIDACHFHQRKEVDSAVGQVAYANVFVQGQPQMHHVLLRNDRLRYVKLLNDFVFAQQSDK